MTRTSAVIVIPVTRRARVSTDSRADPGPKGGGPGLDRTRFETLVAFHMNVAVQGMPPARIAERERRLGGVGKAPFPHVLSSRARDDRTDVERFEHV
jgi:hypothetical protein